MRVLLLCVIFPFFTAGLFAQAVGERLQKAYQRFEQDSQLKYAVASLYVIEARTGKVVFDRNSGLGLPGASTQKVVTAATALELLGNDFRYNTLLQTNGQLRGNSLIGDLVLRGSGDPSLGSWRYGNTKPASILSHIISLLREKKIRNITGDLVVDESAFESNTVSDGWIWEDIGNYYGAGAGGFNWRENQYDLILKSGPKEKDPVRIVRLDPAVANLRLVSEVRAGPRGSGDNAYIYVPPFAATGFVRGTIPAGEDSFKISGSLPNPAGQFGAELAAALKNAGIRLQGGVRTRLDQPPLNRGLRELGSVASPTLDSLIYFFLRRSINLYGEALVKTFALKEQGLASADTGLRILRDFWNQHGISPDELNLYDGSGLSPLNRITTRAQVEVLKFALARPWYRPFYEGLPEFNGMKMKSGTISDVKGFCGYHKAADGTEYIFSFLVNNYSGRASTLVSKMYRVLDELK
ncbi:MAG TPA: D-alanyl-D-alanine carboxypeptidase/D-alanyl-D-alanine-endopeptidase [Chitinophagaceae bacterium]|nr:D-alanyl-D-alanine carboxypeptidase/D-alanyl-D-alanine-endopeptidase [Chitinophagaceae bacterium]